MGLHLKSVLVLSLVLAGLSLSAQQYNFRHYTTADGLPSAQVYQVLEDHQGYIWMATERGICRYDGNEFISYTTEDGLCSNVVFGLRLDNQNRLWGYTFSNCIFYLENEKFHTIPIEDASFLNDARRIEDMVVWNDSAWIKTYGSRMQLFKVDVTGHVEVLRNDPRNRHDSLTDYYLIPTGHGHWLNHTISSMFESPGEERLNIHVGDRVIQHKFMTWARANDKARVLKTGPNRWLMNRYDYACLISDTGVIRQWEFDHWITHSLYLDPEGGFWAGTGGGGAYHMDLNSGRPLHHLLDGYGVTSILRDQEGNLWFSTLANGVFFLPATLPMICDADAGLSGSQLVDVESHLGTIVVAENTGKIHKIDPYTMKHLGELPGAEHQNSMLFSLGDQGLIAGRFPLKKFNSDLSAYEPMWVEAVGIAIDDAGRMYRSATSRIEIDSAGKTITRISLPTYGLSTLPDNTNDFWIGANDGLYRYQSGVVIPMKDSNELYGYRVNQIESFLGREVMATMGAGILIRHHGALQVISRASGLPSDLCQSFHIESDSVLWVGTQKGLCEVRNFLQAPDQWRITNFTQDDGLLNNKVNRIAGLDDYLFLATDDGLVRMDKRLMRTPVALPRVYVRRFSIAGEDTVLRPDYALSHQQNIFSIAFSAPSFRKAQFNRFEYRLNPDQPWVEIHEPKVELYNLIPGTYRFEVRAKGDRGDHGVPASIHLEINPPYWDTWWFKLLIAIGVLGLGAVAFFIQLRNAKRQLALRNQFLDAEQKALSAQITPHFIFNTLNSIQWLISKNKRLEAIDNVAQFSRLMRNILHNSHFKWITLKQESDTLNRYLKLESLRFSEAFHYEITFRDDIDPGKYLIAPLLIQPYVENAIWHGILNKESGSGKVSIVFSMEGQALICTIEDDGVGRAKARELNHSEEKNSLGMKISEQRLKLVGQSARFIAKVEINDIVGPLGRVEGTRVMLTLPLLKVSMDHNKYQISNDLSSNHQLYHN